MLNSVEKDPTDSVNVDEVKRYLTKDSRVYAKLFGSMKICCNIEINWKKAVTKDDYFILSHRASESKRSV